MRDRRFVAMHRGGDLSPEDHRALMCWGISCSQRVLNYYDKEHRGPLIDAMRVAEAWSSGEASTGEAITASRKAHALARTIDDPVAQAIVRSVAHVVATAHMADHSMGGALYAQRALKFAGKPFLEEREWQLEQLHGLPDDLSELVKNTLAFKAKGLGL